MEDRIIVEIGKKLKNIRRAKNITMQELAGRVSISKGLISQIENGRTIPSLTVLLQIIRVLDIDLNHFFNDLSLNGIEQPILVKRKSEYEPFEKEYASGYQYLRIFTKSFSNTTVDVVLLIIEQGATRDFVQTEAFEFKYIVQGTIEYRFPDQTLLLSEGDSLLFDGRIEHTPVNAGETPAIMMAVYFFADKE